MSAVVPVLSGAVNDAGQLRFASDERQALDRWLSMLRGQRVDLTIKVHRRTRTSPQNRYYFGVVVALLAEHCGYDADEMHEALAMKFLRIEDCPVTGAPRRRRTPKTNTQEFGEYLDACIRLASELGVVIPAPGDAEC